jgi:hypothetical protein
VRALNHRHELVVCQHAIASVSHRDDQNNRDDCQEHSRGNVDPSHEISLSAPQGAVAWVQERQSGRRSYVGIRSVATRPDEPSQEQQSCSEEPPRSTLGRASATCSSRLSVLDPHERENHNHGSQ